MRSVSPEQGWREAADQLWATLIMMALLIGPIALGGYLVMHMMSGNDPSRARGFHGR